MTPAISVIVPVYKVEPYIKECLDSIFAQTFRDFELIIVDDCSPDRSIEMAREVCSSAPADIPVTFLRTPKNSGLSVARNTGIEKACGKYLFLIDSDDALTPKALELLNEKATAYPDAEIIYGMSKEVGWPNKLDFLDIKSKNLPPFINDASLARKLILQDYYLPINAQNRLYRRDWIEKYGFRFKPGLLAEDLHLNFYYAKHIKAIAFCPEYTYLYRFNANGISLANKNRMQLCVDWIICDWMRHLTWPSLFAQLKLIFHRAHISYIYHRGEDNPAPPAWVRYPATIAHLARMMRRHGATPPANLR